jgi:hypothetical protein
MSNSNHWLKWMAVLALLALVGCASTLLAEIPTSTPTLALIPSPTFTPIPSATPTHIPTLTVEDARTKFLELLTNNGNCRLPCWLGITPGQSTLTDLHDVLMIFSGIATDTTDGYVVGDLILGSLTIPYISEEGMVIRIRSSFLISSGENNIFMIGADTEAYKITGDTLDYIYGHPAYNDVLKSFTLTEILSTYGQPSTIYVTASLRDVPIDFSPAFGDYFIIHVWYPERGIFMGYKMLAEGAGENFKICPTDAFILLTLIPPELNANYQDLLLKSGGGWDKFFPPSEFVKTPEDAFGITIGDFFRLFNSFTDRCLETPKLIWQPK